MAGIKGRVPSPEVKIKRYGLIKAALEAGAISYVDISNATGLTVNNVNALLNPRHGNTELRGLYLKNLMSLKTVATQNLITAISDPAHPKHWEATKTFLSKYRTELDEVLDKTTDEIIITPSVNSVASMEITFAHQNKSLEDK